MTRPHHAIEITLARPATARELARARRATPLAANADRTRLMAVQQAKCPRRALGTLGYRLEALLPIDVLTTHYPDHRGHVLLNLTLSRTTHAAIRRAAAARGEAPQFAVCVQDRRRTQETRAGVSGFEQDHCLMTLGSGRAGNGAELPPLGRSTGGALSSSRSSPRGAGTPNW